MLVNISFKYRVEMLKLDVSDQRNNKYLPKIQQETDVQSHTTSNTNIIRSLIARHYLLGRGFWFFVFLIALMLQIVSFIF